jgi:beta-lactam-binding protein with PASTA domain
MADVAHGTVVDGRYLIKDRIGSGGMADVYCAEDSQLGREVALKVLHRRFARDREFVERFRREASAAAGLQHPNVVSVFDRGEHDGTYYIAMENLHGRTLKELIREEAPLPQLRAIGLAEQILQAAGFAHRRGVVHRDFKPHNVIVGDDDRLKVTDFGIARAGASEMTETGSIMGTAQYLSPEQAQGQRVGATSDLYSIGVILYEMLTGRVPFPGDSAVSIALKHVSEPPQPLRELRPEIHPLLEAAVMRALVKEPEGRYDNAEQFVAALEAARAAIVGGNGQGTELFVPPASPPRTARRRWPLVLLGLLVLALAAGAIALALLGTKQVRVPYVVNQQLGSAELIVRHAGLRPVARRATSTTVPRGRVISESPRAGNKVDKGSTVTLRYSTGPAEVPVPAVQNLTQQQATRLLRQQGFNVKVEQTPSATVQSGTAIGTQPAAGTLAGEGSTVRLQISSGPQLATVPGVVGLSEGDAIARLQAAGFQAAPNTVTDTAPKGQVISEEPVAGSQAPQGSTVAINVSSGQAPSNKAAVPSVVGADQNTAQLTLGGAGFNVKVVSQPSDKPKGQVVSQSPGGNSQATKGSTVTIVVSNGKQKPGKGGSSGPGAGGPGGNGQNGQ